MRWQLAQNYLNLAPKFDHWCNLSDIAWHRLKAAVRWDGQGQNSNHA